MLYLATMIVPYYLTTITHDMDAKNNLFQLHYGVFHIPSIIYILCSAFILHYFVDSNVSKTKESHQKINHEIIEAEEALDMQEFEPENIVESNNSFIKNIWHVIRHGGIEDDMELIVEKQTLKLATVYEKLISEYGYIAAVLPMLGMLGTITGLLQMFAVTDGVDNIAQKMASLSVALATTLYATLWVVLITKPKSREVETNLIELNEQEHRLILSAKLFLHNADLNLLIEYSENLQEEEDAQTT
jgi:biopolymer transport protein ExbB/TolQ